MSSLNLQMTKAVWLSALPKGVNKMVLLAMCHHFNDAQKLCWPSVGRLALMCGMSERSIQNHIRVLQRVGILVPRMVRTGFATRYAIQLKDLPLIVFPTASASAQAVGQPVDDEPVDNFPEIVIPVDNFADTPAESAPLATEIGTTPPQISTDTPAESAPELSLTVKSTVKGTEPAPALPEASVVFENIDAETVAAFFENRAKKKYGAINATVLETLQAEAFTAGLTMEQVLTICKAKGWAKFEAAWVSEGLRKTVAHLAPTAPVKVWVPDTTPIPPAPAPAGPPPAPLTAQEIASSLAARDVALAALKAKDSPALPAKPAKPALPAMPAGASDISIPPGTAPWVVDVVNDIRAGKYVNFFKRDGACAILKIDPAMLRRAAPAPAHAARMH